MTLFDWGSKTYLMGILNATPDSFSNDGIHQDVDLMISRGIEMLSRGADVLDVGGESSKPPSVYGHVNKVSENEEIQRVVPIIRALSLESKAVISIDTYKAKVAKAAILAGARMVNDIWGLGRDSEMAHLIADTEVYVVIMHNTEFPQYKDVVKDTVEFLKNRVDFAVSAGINKNKIIVDPGIGFAKGVEQNLQILNRLHEYKILGVPVMVGTSRKSTIGEILELPVDDRIEGTAATVSVAIARGVDMVRVHDVQEMYRISKMTDAIVRG
ncbi:uncharacterized protein METZ01_LOCUS152130 [marine metagenome]|uniref:dihydropteroate synthase n=1 Tax=marine metagenome TaxID=408172 RepID=A0A382ACL4_9ZZZZ